MSPPPHSSTNVAELGRAPLDHETLTVAATAIGLTAGKYGDAIRAEMSLELAQIRMWDDGTDPTATVGDPVNVGDRIILKSAAQIAGFKAIRTGGTSGKLSVSYFH
jgi:hypothetical protein